MSDQPIDPLDVDPELEESDDNDGNPASLDDDDDEDAFYANWNTD